MNKETLNKLKELAQKAGEEEWDFDTEETPIRIAGGEVVGGDALPYGDVYTMKEYEQINEDGEPVSEPLTICSEIGAQFGRFIAAANPAAILELIAKVQTPLHEHNARFAIDGAMWKGHEGVDPPPTEDHWLMPYWKMARELAEFKAAAERTTSPVTDEQIDNAMFAADVQGYSYTDAPAGYRAVVRSLLAAAAPQAQAPVPEPVPSYAAQLSTGLNDPFSRQPQSVAEQHARIEKAEREALVEFGTPLQKLGARLTELLDDDQWNEVEPWLLAIVASQHAKE